MIRTRGKIDPDHVRPPSQAEVGPDYVQCIVGGIDRHVRFVHEPVESDVGRLDERLPSVGGLEDPDADIRLVREVRHEDGLTTMEGSLL